MVQFGGTGTVSELARKAVSLLRGMSSGDPDLVVRDVSPNGLIQHDLPVADGVDGLRERAVGLDVVRVLEDGPLVAVHGQTGSGDGGEVFFAVFRLYEGVVVERWRFAAPLAPPNQSGHSQTDGPTEPDVTHGTETSKSLVRDYYETVHIGGRHELIDRYMASGVQLRHEPGVRDGVNAFKQDLALLTQFRTIDEIVLLAGQADFVFIAARGTHEGAPCAYIDLYRVEDGGLIEHWGFPQAIPSAPTGNGNGLL